MPNETPRSATLGRTFWILLAAGILIRCVALTHPLADAHLLRQCQTAAATQSLVAHGFSLSAPIPWVGDFHERFLLELPVYNWLVVAVHAVTGNLTLSGKLVSVALWALSFFLLQAIWRRILAPCAAIWANVLFVVSPLGVFYAQAFMPEMLVQALAFAFVLLLIRHDENPTLARWLPAAATGLLALVVKAPETAHLYVIFILLALRRGGWRELFRVPYLLAGVVSAACVVAWTAYLGKVNVSPLSFGGAGDTLRGFIGPLVIRFQFKTWLMIALYVAGFLIPGFSTLSVARGVPEIMRAKSPRLLVAWLVALAIFYLAWLGNGPASQSYYNLPALAPLCALFGLGMNAFLESPRVQRRRVLVAGIAATLTAGCAAPVWIYLFKQDHPILAAARWAREHTAPGSVILFHAGHRADMRDYTPNAVFPFYAERPSFIWTEQLMEPYRTAALQRSRFAIVTLPLPEGTVAAAIRRIRGMPLPPAPSTGWLREIGFAPVAEEPGFVAFGRQ